MAEDSSDEDQRRTEIPRSDESKRFDFDAALNSLKAAADELTKPEVQKTLGVLFGASNALNTIQDALRTAAIQDAQKGVAIQEALRTVAIQDAVKAVAIQDAVKAVAIQDALKAIGTRLASADQAVSLTEGDLPRMLEIIRAAAKAASNEPKA